ncbi:KINECTIN-LIKE PROTEIN [Salix koriyanagi]|uniref:KINECTIN-LIKE PROTEIN n=1 Tax=Salix koriyanagi TaxID=2511006 RepID=A0A9Q0UMQ3_9ROSI|nr:KINECTIN-LIKE PROTEIN [Salix koriyanagi]
MAGEDVDLSSLTLQVGETREMWKQEMERRQSQVDVLQVQTYGGEGLCTRVGGTCKGVGGPVAKSENNLDIELEGVGLVDRNGTPMPSWSRDVDLSSFGPDEESCLILRKQQGSYDEQDEAYIGELLKSVQMVSDVMEGLVKRVIMAESETALEKDKEMERFALGTNGILNDLRKRVEDLVEETSRQRQCAAENEQELCRVKRDFDSLKSYVSSLISVRETLLSSERQFQTIERLFERLVAKTTQLEGEKMQKETEVQKLMEENVRLSALLDKKEAQLLGMNEQCKLMALNASNI